MADTKSMEESPKEHKFFQRKLNVGLRKAGVTEPPQLKLVSTARDFFNSTQSKFSPFYWLDRITYASMSEKEREDSRIKEEAGFKEALQGRTVATHLNRKGTHAVVYIEPGTEWNVLENRAEKLAAAIAARRIMRG